MFPLPQRWSLISGFSCIDITLYLQAANTLMSIGIDISIEEKTNEGYLYEYYKTRPDILAGQEKARTYEMNLMAQRRTRSRQTNKCTYDHVTL